MSWSRDVEAAADDLYAWLQANPDGGSPEEIAYYIGRTKGQVYRAKRCLSERFPPNEVPLIVYRDGYRQVYCLTNDATDVNLFIEEMRKNSATRIDHWYHHAWLPAARLRGPSEVNRITKDAERLLQDIHDLIV